MAETEWACVHNWYCFKNMSLVDLTYKYPPRAGERWTTVQHGVDKCPPRAGERWTTVQHGVDKWLKSIFRSYSSFITRIHLSNVRRPTDRDTWFSLPSPPPPPLSTSLSFSLSLFLSLSLAHSWYIWKPSAQDKCINNFAAYSFSTLILSYTFISIYILQFKGKKIFRTERANIKIKH